MEIKCSFSYTLLQTPTGFSINEYKADEQVALPDGTRTKKFRAKGYMLPCTAGSYCKLKGEFERYVAKDKRTCYTMRVEDCEELHPTDRDSAISYLMTLKGVGKVMAERMYDQHGDNVFNLLQNDSDKLTDIKGISKAKATAIAESYAKKRYARQLFQFLFPYNISDSKIMRLYRVYGDESIAKIKENPYRLSMIAGISFNTAEKIAEAQGLAKDFPPRIKAAILEVLLQGELGGPLFNKRSTFPTFCYQCFLRQPLFDLLSQPEITNVTGGTFLPRDVLYVQVLKLVKIPLTEADFDAMLLDLHQEKRIFISTLQEKGEERVVKVYRYQIAQAEFSTAKKIIKLMQHKDPDIPDLAARVYNAERKLGMILSDEQRKAVEVAMTTPVSVITGGPGTGKTSVQKTLLSVFHTLYPKEEELLLAPTGRAAKRMSESAGYPASTIHSALGLYNNEDGDLVSSEENVKFTQKLIIVDECSMVGTVLMHKLMENILEGSHVVLVGDIDQLPSVEIGAVLREIIDSQVVPITRLTKTYRQAGDSPIAVNAARIRCGVTDLEYGSDFQMLERENSNEIAETATELYQNLANSYSLDEIMCLSAYRRSTLSGSNALNESIRSALRSDITDKTPCIERNGMKIYPKDRIMFTRNTQQLANGDIGVLDEIKKTSDGLRLFCTFNGNKVILEDNQTAFIDLAYATTVHKSQGSESKAVILIADRAHKNMLRKALLYTGITRAKRSIYIIGQSDAFIEGILCEDSIYRRSYLAALIRYYKNRAEKAASTQDSASKKKTASPPLSGCEQLSFNV